MCNLCDVTIPLFRGTEPPTLRVGGGVPAPPAPPPPPSPVPPPLEAFQKFSLREQKEVDEHLRLRRSKEQ